MNHPALRHIRKTLALALGVAGAYGCNQSPAPTAADAELPADDGPADGGSVDPSADGGPVDPPACEGAEILRGPTGQPTGYVRCPDDGIDRVGPAACEPRLRGFDFCTGEERDEGGCVADSDCGDRPGGLCAVFDINFGGICGCVYPCATDSDCNDGQVCVCDTPSGARCVTADCQGAEDCGGQRCGVADFDFGCGRSTAVTCRTAGDACISNDECGQGEDCWPAGESGEDAWHCSGPQAVCGRPLRVAGRARLAGGIARRDWRAPIATDAVPRRLLAEHWGAIAALEHASVASFARFSLQLLALGAPSDLVADCQQAAADEVEHARLAYGIASIFAGEAIGPGPLSLDDMTLETDPATVLREVIVEGCIGETFGAVEAAEAARHISDPAIAAACARIAEDELRHAALGWRVAQWLLEGHPELASVAADAFEDGIAHHTDGIVASEPAIIVGGVAVRPDVRRAAVAEVIGPLAARLLAG